MVDIFVQFRISFIVDVFILTNSQLIVKSSLPEFINGGGSEMNEYTTIV